MNLSRQEKEDWMLQAVALAERGRGLTKPNPCVGALITIDNAVVASGWHKAYGLAHAEAEAISEVRQKGCPLSQAVLWVTLEPCNHQGRTPPCTQAILESGIQRVMVGTRDPNTLVAGGGAEYLRSRGVEVETGIAEQACLDLVADFIVWNREQRPFVYLKLAMTLDGKIATRSGHSKWISSEAARSEVHGLRSLVQAILVGGETFYADDPRLSCRTEPPLGGKQPLAVVATSRLPDAGLKLNLLREEAKRLVILAPVREAASEAAQSLRRAGVRVVGLDQGPCGLDLKAGLQMLYQEYGCYYLLCEGGGRLAASLAEAGLADELRLYIAPKILGDESARQAFAGRRIERMDQALAWRIVDSGQAGEDVKLRLRPAATGMIDPANGAGSVLL